MSIYSRNTFITALVLLLIIACGFIYKKFFSLQEPIWKQIYYPGSPDVAYCKASTPGVFIGTVKEELKNGAVSDKKIKLINFSVRKIYQSSENKYELTGSVVESWMEDGEAFKDTIYFKLSKIGENGITKGTWFNSRCNGSYEGYVIK